MPVGEAQYVGIIASLTGWTEEYIRWELPLSRGWAYFHTARIMDGATCHFEEEAEAWGDSIRDKLKKLT